MPESTEKGIYNRVEPPTGLLPADRWRLDRKMPRPSHRQHRQTRKKAMVRWVGRMVVVAAIAFPAYQIVKKMRQWQGRTRAAAIREEAVRFAGADSTPQPSGDLMISEVIETAKKVDFLVLEVLPLMDRGLYVEAERKILNQLETAPDQIELKQALVDLYLRTKRWPEARDLLVGILRTVPGKLDARLQLAHASLELGRFEDAYRIARWILEGDPLNGEALRLATRASLSTAEFMQAMTHIRVLLEVLPDDVQARQFMAIAYLRMGQYSRAVTRFSELIQLNPSDPVNHYNLAVCYAQQAQVEETVNTLHRALSHVRPDVVRAWISEKDFDSVRGDPLLRVFETELASDSSERIMIKAKPDAGVGLMPEAPMVELRTIDSRKR